MNWIAGLEMRTIDGSRPFQKASGPPSCMMLVMMVQGESTGVTDPSGRTRWDEVIRVATSDTGIVTSWFPIPAREATIRDAPTPSACGLLLLGLADVLTAFGLSGEDSTEEGSEEEPPREAACAAASFSAFCVASAARASMIFLSLEYRKKKVAEDRPVSYGKEGEEEAGSILDTTVDNM